MQDDKVFELYKPLRNHLAKISIGESFFVIWSYVQHLQFNNKISSEIEVISEFINNDRIQKIRMCAEWEIETLMREIIINSQNGIYAEKSLRKWSYFAGAINKLKDIENDISGIFINQNNLLVELFRIAHRQFPWQTRPNMEYLTRYYKIFSYGDLAKILEKTLGINTKKLYLAGFALTGVYLKSVAVNLPIDVQIDTINSSDIEKFISIFSSDFQSLKEKIRKESEYNDKFVYSFSSLRSTPLLRTQYHQKNCLVCPLPTLLFWQITEGIYYKILNQINGIESEQEKGRVFGEFGNALGNSFQNYAGEVINKANQSKALTIYSEATYNVGKKMKNTVDWLIEDAQAILFVECKTKKMMFPAKVELNDDSFIKNELSKMADFLLQTYKSIIDYKNNKYHSLNYRADKKIFPIILTMEQWYLFGDRFLNELDKILREKFLAMSMDEKIIDEHPYSICSMDEFEELMQIINKIGIIKFMENKFNGEKKLWAYKPFMISDFKQEYAETKSLFPDVYKEIYPNDTV